MIPDDVLQLCMSYISLHVGQVVEALAVLRMLRNLFGRKHAVQLAGNGARIDHDILGASGMDVDTPDLEQGGRGIKVFIGDLALIIPVHGICVIRLEMFQVKGFEAPSHFLVRRDPHPDVAVGNLFPDDLLHCG